MPLARGETSQKGCAACSALASERQVVQQLQSRKAWGVTRAELERQLAQQRRSAEADKAASLQSLKDLFQRCCCPCSASAVL